MQNLRALRQRIKSVQNTQKITKAMQMVAGAKLRRSLEELVAFRPYAERLSMIAQRFSAAYPSFDHPLMKDGRADAPAGLVLITSDTGLCGTYNERILAAANVFLKEFPSGRVVTIGRKGARSMTRRAGTVFLKETVSWGGKYDPAEVLPFVGWMEQLFLSGEISSWYVAHTRFISALQWKPVVARLFPLERPASDTGFTEKLIVEPSPVAVADRLLRQFVRAQFARMLLEAFTAEHSARMVAMKNATENADGMIKNLTLIRNKARQASITKELIEVVSGAQAALQ